MTPSVRSGGGTGGNWSHGRCERSRGRALHEPRRAVSAKDRSGFRSTFACGRWPAGLSIGHAIGRFERAGDPTCLTRSSRCPRLSTSRPPRRAPSARSRSNGVIPGAGRNEDAGCSRWSPESLAGRVDELADRLEPIECVDVGRSDSDRPEILEPGRAEGRSGRCRRCRVPGTPGRRAW